MQGRGSLTEMPAVSAVMLVVLNPSKFAPARQLQDINKLVQLDTDLMDVLAALKGGLSAGFVHQMLAHKISFQVSCVKCVRTRSVVNKHEHKKPLQDQQAV